MKHFRIVCSVAALLLTACTLASGAAMTPADPTVPSRIAGPIDLRDTVTLTGNTHPLATPAVDQGPVPGQQQLSHLFIVLQRSAAQERELTAFNARQYDATSADYHHWLQPDEYGRIFGPNDRDIAAVTGWLESAGFKIQNVSPGRISIEFSGTAAQVQNAFHVQMHRYLVNGAAQIANDRDPQVPRAVSPVVAGVAGLNDFPLKSDVVQGTDVTLDTASGRFAPYTEPSFENSPTSVGVTPLFTVHDGTPLFEFVAPYDLATIYNALPSWNAGITGAGVTIALIGQTDSDVNLNDIATFRSSFGLPPYNSSNVPSIEYVGANPGGSSFANTVLLEMAGAAAPGAKLVLVVPDGGTNSSTGTITIGGFLDAIHYIIAHNNANIVSTGFSDCELFLGTSNNAMVTSVWQQAQTLGISVLTSTGNAGSAACASGDSLDTYGLQVSGIASSQFVTAVGGTDFGWDWIPNGGAYWNTTNTADHASAKGYVPEFSWNVSCANPLVEREFLVDGKIKYPSPIDVCNAIENSPTYSSLVTVQGGGGGYSHCTSLNASGGCSAGSGYAKPTWQTGTGVPVDGKRDLPDVALFASAGWPKVPGSSPPTALIPYSAAVFCYSGGGHACTYDTYGHIIYQSGGGTGLAAAYFAGILAIVEQKYGGTREGLVNPTLYKLFAKESLSSCSTLTVKAGNTCTFYDIPASPTNSEPYTISQPCKGGSTTACDNASGGVNFEIGVLTGYSSTNGYDQATGLGSVNITNLVDNWDSVAPSPTISLSAANLTFGSIAKGATSAPQTLIVKNIGRAVVTFSSGGITLSGTGAASFTKSTTCTSTLVVGGKCTITVAFKPTAVGSASATLSIADNAAGSPQGVSLSGTGISG